jgi:hypothetical protein
MMPDSRDTSQPASALNWGKARASAFDCGSFKRHSRKDLSNKAINIFEVA